MRSSTICYVYFYAVQGYRTSSPRGSLQLYGSFKADEFNAQDEAIRAMEDCIKDKRNWLTEGRLLLNDDKTEFLVIGSRRQLKKIKSISTSCR